MNLLESTLLIIVLVFAGFLLGYIQMLKDERDYWKQRALSYEPSLVSRIVIHGTNQDGAPVNETLSAQIEPEKYR